MRQGLVFLIQQLVLATVFYIILVSSASFNFGNPQKKDIKIKITFGDTIKDTLALNPYGIDTAYRGKKVTWLIDTGASAKIVKSFSIEIKPKSHNVFADTAPPPAKKTRDGYGRITDSASGEYTYSILWVDTIDTTRKHTYDPKIAIMPSTFTKEQIIYIAYGLIALILSLRFFSKRTKK